MKILTIPLVFFAAASLELILPLFGKLKKNSGIFSVFAAMLSLFLLYFLKPQGQTPESFFMNGLTFSAFSFAAWTVILIPYLFFAFNSFETSKYPEVPSSEYHFLAGISIVGALFMSATENLLTMFIALETLSIPLYALTGIRRNEESLEAAMKYFLLGAFGSVLAAMGLALIYGIFGTFDLNQISAMKNSAPPLASAGIMLFSIAFFFKAAIVPFHFWAADVYEAAPSSVSALMASSVKAAAIIALLKFSMFAFSAAHFEYIFWFSAITMLAANLMALPQENLKRLLAYSGISHAGYMLIGFLGGTAGASGMFFYLAAYTLASVGFFSVISRLERKPRGLKFRDISGLYRKSPILAAAISVFALSLAGVPPLAGFFGKFYVFMPAVQKGYTSIVVLAVIMSAVSLYYYLKFIVYMFMKDPAENPGLSRENPGLGFRIAMLMIAAALILIGIFSPFLVPEF